MNYPIAGRRRANPIRLSVARDLGRDIDAWWPRVDRVSNELPDLVAALTPLLGHITSINVNWSPLQRPPDFNRLGGWEGKRQHLITVSGTDACANLLIISYATHSALALMVMRRAAKLPIDDADRAKPAFLTAGSILRAAQQQCASGY